MSACDYCGKPLRGPRAGISYSHSVDAEGTPLSDEPLPESKHFCSKDCLDLWDERISG
jgi:hypothetical protein